MTYLVSFRFLIQNKMFLLLVFCPVLMFDVDLAAILLFLELTHFLELEYRQINNHWKRRGTLETIED